MTITLVALRAETIRALHEGRSDWAVTQPELSHLSWPDEDRRMLRYRVEALDEDPTSAPYLVHAAFSDGDFVGRIGCHAAPDQSGEVEIGYAVIPAKRGQRIGGQIVDAFLAWLRAEGVQRVRASVSPDNEPSLRLLTRRGFVEVGEQWDDEDGRELILVTSFA